ncbi:hypothetical protein POM88_018741 [Heracleum sosnowskyi]|uniref:UBC core domain-containing protein n=1 Tax=Heracleum sosnowskyi TaxID=360622 RepID=A0AAD8ISW3_9APIA|nr:hypothetical protein POM88_018741 [Heracleum sosnowskyi]
MPYSVALSKIACNRLQKELVEWQVNPPSGFKHKVTDNLQRWVIQVNGAPGTLYSNETYQLQVDFPEHYPMEAPQLYYQIEPELEADLSRSKALIDLFDEIVEEPLFNKLRTKEQLGYVVEYVFYLSEKEATELESIRKSDVVNWYKTYLRQPSPKCQRLVVRL